MRDLSTFNTCPYGHPKEWHDGIQDFICPTCEYAVSRWVTELIERVENLDLPPVPRIEGPGFTMIGKPYNPPVREPSPYLHGALGGLAVILAALCIGAAIIYFRMSSIFNP